MVWFAIQKCQVLLAGRISAFLSVQSVALKPHRNQRSPHDKPQQPFKRHSSSWKNMGAGKYISVPKKNLSSNYFFLKVYHTILLSCMLPLQQFFVHRISVAPPETLPNYNYDALTRCVTTYIDLTALFKNQALNKFWIKIIVAGS